MQLTELMQAVLDVKLKDPDPDDSLAILHMADCQYDNECKPLEKPATVFAALAVGPGAVIARLARLMVATCEPSCAVLALPSYTASLRDGQRLEDFGVTRVSDLPRDMVQDSLVVYGEDAEGHTEMHMYVIERDDNLERVWVERKDHDSYESRFSDLFILPKLLRETKVQQSMLGLSPEDAQKYGKAAVLRFLTEGLPDDLHAERM